MPVTTVVVALVLAAVIVTTGRRRHRPSSWSAFARWTAAGFLSALATISFAIGLLVLPFAVLAIVVASRFGSWPDALGFLAGVGLVGVLVWALALGESPGYWSWLAVGAALVLGSGAAFRVWRRAA